MHAVLMNSLYVGLGGFAGSVLRYLAGVVAAVHTRQALGQIILTQGTPAATFSDMIDLGIVYKAGAIQETVDVLVQSKGIQLESPPSAETLA